MFIQGLFAGAFATVATYVGATLIGIPFPPQAIFQLLISPVPGSIESFIVETFREYGKYSAFAFASAIYVLLYTLVAVLVGLLFSAKRFYAILVGTGITSAIGFGLELTLAARASVLTSVLGWLAVVGLLLVVNLAYSMIVIEQVGASRPQIGKQPSTMMSPSRRGFLKKIAVLAAVVAFAGIAAKIGFSLLSGQPVVRSNTPIPTNGQPPGFEFLDAPDILRDPRISDLVASEVTDNRVFYRVDINPIPPQLDFDQWSLKISGKVNNPTTLNRSSLLALPTRDEYATLECVSNTINPPSALISNAKWTGVPVSKLLDQVGVARDAKYVVFHCADGYSVGVPLDRAMQPGALLTYKMNDEFLPNGHGFPLRAIVPGIYGMMNAKWITEIEVVDYVYLGYWQQRGWSNDARIKTISIVYYPLSEAQVKAPLPIAGVAFAGDRGISKVEVSVDGGNTWQEAFLKKPKSPYSWVLWAYEWNPPNKGTYTITARAYDGQGQVQDQTARPPFPDGASGYHAVQVTVV